MSLKILLADDSLTAQNMAKKILTEAGYQVIAVSNGAQALKKIISDQPDLVLLDVYMPGYTGVELCQRMRDTRETARTPVLLSVGKMEAFKAEEVTRVRADGLIIKPFEATELIAMVQKLEEKLAPRLARRPERESEPEMVVEPNAIELPAFEPEFPPAPRTTIEIPEAVAFTPAIGMELIPEEPAKPSALSHEPIEFEVERDSTAEPALELPHMVSAAGLSGVFEIEPTAHPEDHEFTDPAPSEGLETFASVAEAPASPLTTEPIADAAALTVIHHFQTETPQGRADEPAAQDTPAVEAPSSFADASPAERAAEQLDHPAPEAEIGSQIESPPELQVLPELAYSEESAAQPADELLQSADPMRESFSAEFAAPAPVWVAEQAEIEPAEFAIPLHQQMQRDLHAGEMGGFDSPAGSAVGVTFAAPSWEAPGEFSEPVKGDVPTPQEAGVLPEFGIPPYVPALAAANGQEAANEFALSRPESAAGERQSPAESAQVLEESYHAAVSELASQAAVPVVTEVPVDPLRVARIVEQVLERLRPEVIAAVTRELENKR